MAPARRRVLYYAHQHGAGHLRHAAGLASTGAFDVTVVTAHPRAAELLPADVPVIPLPSDLVPGHEQPARSPLHWSPVGPEIRARFDALHAAARRVDPDVCVVDVSVEAALFLRLAGWPVLHRRMHGERTDPAHALVYAEADGLFAHYAAELEVPAWRAAHADRVTYLGVADVTGRLGTRATTTASAGGAPRVAVIAGRMARVTQGVGGRVGAARAGRQAFTDAGRSPLLFDIGRLLGVRPLLELSPGLRATYKVADDAGDAVRASVDAAAGSSGTRLTRGLAFGDDDIANAVSAIHRIRQAGGAGAQLSALTVLADTMVVGAVTVPNVVINGRTAWGLRDSMVVDPIGAMDQALVDQANRVAIVDRWSMPLAGAR